VRRIETPAAPAAAIPSSREQKPVTTERLAEPRAKASSGPRDLAPGASVSKAAFAKGRRGPDALANADKVLDLDLPQQMDMVQLLDLVGEYLELDYLYEPEKIKGQTVTLKLHGKLRGEMRVRDLYLLLESVLKFKGYAMTCHEGNLVTIVPAADALQANPDLIEPGADVLETGDMVVTSVFELRNIEVAAATSLLTNMKLSLAATPVDGVQALIVTCYAHQIERIEQLLDLIDRPGRPREFRSRRLRYTMARSLTQKIKVLAAEMRSVSIVAGPAPKAASNGSRPAPIHQPGQVAGTSGAEPVYLDADDRTNRILMIGYREQIAIIEDLVDVLDVAQQDLRVLKIYDVRHVEADEVRKKLQELEIIGGGRSSGGGPAGAGKIGGAEAVRDAVTDEPVVVVLEATNCLVVNASEEQHGRIEAMMDYLDAEVRTEAIPYEIYFLENQDPDNLAQVLENIIHETVQDKEGKLQKILRNAEDQIVIVPDKQTFSLIVYASRKNQEWISKLIEALDRERSQVLIDVTLVEIRKSDEFNYDLNWITSIPDLVETGGQTGQFFVDENTTVVEKLLQPGMRSQFADLEFGSEAATGFYADLHVNALLEIMQKKNYGRVLAKPKVLVNDNQKGTIKTTDTTYVETRSGIPVSSGTVGNQQNFVETSLKYEPYEAGIMLEITPHISDGDLLRLEINLTRSDFGVITGKKPPDQTSSDINTVVTVPDGHTIILGGLLRLNQTKGGNKVPILGDIPLVGMAFRSIANSDMQSKLYIFVKAEIIRPAGTREHGMANLDAISERNRMALEEHEQEFQAYENWPGITPRPVHPGKVLEAQ
jgi:type II secretory pathway component GspD/PulD (secretin)